MPGPPAHQPNLQQRFPIWTAPALQHAACAQRHRYHHASASASSSHLTEPRGAPHLEAAAGCGTPWRQHKLYLHIAQRQLAYSLLSSPSNSHRKLSPRAYSLTGQASCASAGRNVGTAKGIAGNMQVRHHPWRRTRPQATHGPLHVWSLVRTPYHSNNCTHRRLTSQLRGHLHHRAAISQSGEAAVLQRPSCRRSLH